MKQGITITVGVENAAVVGSDHRALQAAVDYVAGLGGGSGVHPCWSYSSKTHSATA